MNPCTVAGKGMFSELELKSLVAAVLEKKKKNRELENVSVYSSKWVSQKMCSCEMSNKHTASLDLIISQSHTCY